MADKRDYSKVTIINIMADGSVRDSMKGYKVAFDRLPLAAKEILRKIVTEKATDAVNR